MDLIRIGYVMMFWFLIKQAAVSITLELQVLYILPSLKKNIVQHLKIYFSHYQLKHPIKTMSTISISMSPSILHDNKLHSAFLLHGDVCQFRLTAVTRFRSQYLIINIFYTYFVILYV